MPDKYTTDGHIIHPTREEGLSTGKPFYYYETNEDLNKMFGMHVKDPEVVFCNEEWIKKHNEDISWLDNFTSGGTELKFADNFCSSLIDMDKHKVVDGKLVAHESNVVTPDYSQKVDETMEHLDRLRDALLVRFSDLSESDMWDLVKETYPDLFEVMCELDDLYEDYRGNMSWTGHSWIANSSKIKKDADKAITLLLEPLVGLIDLKTLYG